MDFENNNPIVSTGDPQPPDKFDENLPGQAAGDSSLLDFGTAVLDLAGNVIQVLDKNGNDVTGQVDVTAVDNTTASSDNTMYYILAAIGVVMLIVILLIIFKAKKK
jgi:hypothetical protein